VTAAGLVFAFTMGSMVFSELRLIGQGGTTIALGLIFDTLVVRSLMTPSIAALLGRWFWWPMNIGPRLVRHQRRSSAVGVGVAPPTSPSPRAVDSLR
jgi:RND superfamily putative drug exporter